jgi:hypothetical protein
MIDCDDQELEKRATHRMSEFALSLQKAFSPIDTVGLLIGAAVGVLETNYGRRGATAYIRGLLDEMTADDRAQDLKDSGPSLN